MQINKSGRPLPSLMGYLAQVTPVARSTIEMSRELTASLCLILYFRLRHVLLGFHCKKHHRLGVQLHSVRQGIVTFPFLTDKISELFIVFLKSRIFIVVVVPNLQMLDWQSPRRCHSFCYSHCWILGKQTRHDDTLQGSLNSCQCTHRMASYRSHFANSFTHLQLMLIWGADRKEESKWSRGRKEGE